MDKRTKTALKKSIKYWEAIVEGTETSSGIVDCALCIEFFNSYDDDNTNCVGCPVSAKTDQDCCQGSPYDLFMEDATLVEFGNVKGYTWKGAWDEEAVKAKAQDELDFLKSLLPS